MDDMRRTGICQEMGDPILFSAHIQRGGRRDEGQGQGQGQTEK